MSSSNPIVSQFVSVVRRQLPGGRLLACVSGGADSMAMFHALRMLGTDFTVIHCNFHLRGDESDRDEYFVADVCRKYRVECHVEHFNVKEYCTLHCVSVEMACRELRYNLFRHLKKELNCIRIAVAHNSDDNIETMLLNLFRGTGLRGLAGMQTDTGEILRPLLSLTRQEIELYMKTIGEGFIVDSSNLSNNYRRNYIRNSLISTLQEEWPGIRKALRRTQANISDALDVYDETMAHSLRGIEQHLSSVVLEKAPSKAALLYEFLKTYSPTDSQIREMAVCNNAGARWQLNGVEVVFDHYGFTILSDNDNSEPEFEYTTIRLNEDVFKEICSNKNQNIIYLPLPAGRYRFREWVKGDKIKSLGMKGSQLVSDVIKDAQLSPEQRKRVRVLEEVNSREIVWVSGIKRSRHCLLSPDSPDALKIQYLNCNQT